MDCGGNGCAACGGCEAARSLTLTEAELALLEQLAQTPFLPVGKALGEYPIYREVRDRSPEEYGKAILALERKGLIRVDSDLPLSGFDYGAYRDCPLRGSMALTARGQTVVEQIEIQGIEE